jgi:hypothetical protein
MWEYARPYNFMFMVMISDGYSFDFVGLSTNLTRSSLSMMRQRT